MNGHSQILTVPSCGNWKYCSSTVIASSAGIVIIVINILRNVVCFTKLEQTHFHTEIAF